MTEISTNNKRIAKNTLLLYFRMLLTMIVSLYTSRIVLNALGVEDYGIYNVVGGLVAMFTVISGSLSAAISRYITFELGRKDLEKLKTVFSSAVTIQIVIALVVVVVAETIGLWFLNNKMIIPVERIDAANWLYQFSILIFVINLICIPYNATIIAHERTSAFAYISIFEAVGKLSVAYLIVVAPIDKLIFYSILMFIFALSINITYAVYCRLQFVECIFRFIFNKRLLYDMFSFAGWNFIGASSAILRDQGGNLVINLFCGPAVNAARGIAMQVSNAVQGFVTNFMTALNPQITKSYACGNYDYMMALIFQGSRFAYYILLLLSLPVIVNAQYILTLWLGIVPQHTVSFVQLVLIFAMSESLAGPLVTAMLATGKIRNYQIVVGGLQLLNLPISYVLLRLGYIPEIVVVVAIIISVCCEIARLYMLRSMLKLSVKTFLIKVYFNVIVTTIFASIIPFIFKMHLDENFLNFIITSLVCILFTLLSVLYIGCNKNERIWFYGKIAIFKKKFKN